MSICRFVPHTVTSSPLRFVSCVALACALGACGRQSAPEAETPTRAPGESVSGGGTHLVAEEASEHEAKGGVAEASAAPEPPPMPAPAAAAPPAGTRAKKKAEAAPGRVDTSADGLAGEGEAMDDSMESVAVAKPSPRPEPRPLQVARAQLTAGMFDDNQSFDFFRQYRDRIAEQQLAGMTDFGQWHERAHRSYQSAQHSRSRLDISLVIDTTGSMGDELGYLQHEFESISRSIASSYPNSEQRWSLIVYRDEGDEYVVRSKPFTPSLERFQVDLSQETFGGGGDYPEAPDQALSTAAQLRWRGGKDVARLLFWVADAPHHQERARALRDAVLAAQRSDIHIYPVASSGVDELTEYTMRSAAQVTHGRYVFLTDDSGVGRSHKEPTLPCYYVTTLSDAILRSVATEMSGRVWLPESDRIVRQVGNIDGQGHCNNATGAWAF